MSPTAGRPRDAGVDDRIGAAALALLRERGPEAVHIDAVAARSGVARTTIYRRHRDREALLAATLAAFAGDAFPQADLPVEEKLRWVFEQVRALVEEHLGRGAIAAVLTDSDPAFTVALRTRLRGWFEVLEREIAADVSSGRLRRGVDVEGLAALAFGAYLGELLQHGRARRGWADGVLELLLLGVGPQPRRRPV
ncbi:TetR/AcrR family transcriptional regulator [Terrabacter sp. 2RAF25]|uniref:TetR/AcrR family transcriptional regulator n=1 Tax=Terrabacter sp. 2RAF25 TaxID=3232998 RepID=UPI003F9DFB8A